MLGVLSELREELTRIQRSLAQGMDLLEGLAAGQELTLDGLTGLVNFWDEVATGSHYEKQCRALIPLMEHVGFPLHSHTVLMLHEEHRLSRAALSRLRRWIATPGGSRLELRASLADLLRLVRLRTEIESDVLHLLTDVEGEGDDPRE